MTKQLNIRISENEIYETGAGLNKALGTRGYAPDGRVYRAVLNSAAVLTIGKLIRRPEKTLGHGNLSIATHAERGAPKLDVTLTYDRMTLNEYRDGLLYVNDGAGQGEIYGIASNTATIPGATATITLNIPLKTILTTSSEVSLIRNRYQGVRATETVVNERALGAAPIAIAANTYFWAQVAGPATILQDGAWDEINDLVPSDQVRGAAMAASSVSQRAATRITDVTFADRQVLSNVVPSTAVTNTVGYAIDPRADTEHGLVHLSVDV